VADLIGLMAMNRVVSHLDEVRRDVKDHADAVGDVAKARLAGHTKTGEHQITVTHGEVDSFVNLEGVHPESVEFGHWVEGKYKSDPPKFAQGLYILTLAAQLDATPKQGPRRAAP
jgi:hypothetical protein